MEGLILVTARQLARGGDLVGQIGRALGGVAPGSMLVHLREKDLDGRELAELASAVVAVARRHGARVVINDRVDIALATGADGVHLPENGMTVADARSLLPASSLVGASVHSKEGAHARQGADYLVMGPVWATPGKTACGLNALTEVVRVAARVPVFAIGGIDVARAAEAVGAGAAGVAAIRALMEADHPEADAAALVAAARR